MKQFSMKYLVKKFCVLVSSVVMAIGVAISLSSLLYTDTVVSSQLLSLCVLGVIVLGMCMAFKLTYELFDTGTLSPIQ